MSSLLTGLTWDSPAAATESWPGFARPLTMRGPLGVTVTGDVDGDGSVDVVRATGTRLDVFRQLGDGPPGPPVRTEASGSGLVLGDVDGDGRLDAVLLRGLDIDVRLGGGDGTFGPAVTTTVMAPDVQALKTVSTGDLNDDGADDVAASTSSTARAPER